VLYYCVIDDGFEFSMLPEIRLPELDQSSQHVRASTCVLMQVKLLTTSCSLLTQFPIRLAY